MDRDVQREIKRINALVNSDAIQQASKAYDQHQRLISKNWSAIRAAREIQSAQQEINRQRILDADARHSLAATQKFLASAQAKNAVANATEAHERAYQQLDASAMNAAARLSEQILEQNRRSWEQIAQSLQSTSPDVLFQHAASTISSLDARTLLEQANEEALQERAAGLPDELDIGPRFEQMTQTEVSGYFDWLFELDREQLISLVAVLFKLVSAGKILIGVATVAANPQLTAENLSTIFDILECMLIFALAALGEKTKDR